MQPFQYIRGNGLLRLTFAKNLSSDELEVFCAGLAAHLVGLGLERHLLSFGKAGQASALDCTDVNEHIIAAVVRLDETKALLAVKPLHDTSRHISIPFRV